MEITIKEEIKTFKWQSSRFGVESRENFRFSFLPTKQNQEKAHTRHTHVTNSLYKLN